MGKSEWAFYQQLPIVNKNVGGTQNILHEAAPSEATDALPHDSKAAASDSSSCRCQFAGGLKRGAGGQFPFFFGLLAFLFFVCLLTKWVPQDNALGLRLFKMGEDGNFYPVLEIDS